MDSYLSAVFPPNVSHLVDLMERQCSPQCLILLGEWSRVVLLAETFTGHTNEYTIIGRLHHQSAYAPTVQFERYHPAFGFDVDVADFKTTGRLATHITLSNMREIVTLYGLPEDQALRRNAMRWMYGTHNPSLPEVFRVAYWTAFIDDADHPGSPRSNWEKTYEFDSRDTVR